MDALNRIKAANELKQVKQLEQTRHAEMQVAMIQNQETILKAFSTLVDYLDNRVGKTEVINQLRSVNTPDAMKVVKSIEQLHETIKTHENTDLSEITEVMKKVLAEAEKIPKSHPESKELPDRDYSKHFKDLNDAIIGLKKVVEQQELIAEAPVINLPETVVNVEKPDLTALEDGYKAIVKAVKGIVIPETKLDTLPVEKLIKTTNKLLNEFLDTVPSGGGSGGRATPYQDENGVPAFVTLDNGAIPTTQGGVAAYQINDIEDAATSYFGFTKSDGEYMIKKVTDTSVSYATIANNSGVTSYTEAWTDRATLTFGRYDVAF